MAPKMHTAASFDTRMPTTLTKYFGSVEYRDCDVIHFPSGLPAFESESQFLALEPPASAPLVFLQSLHQERLCFLALPVLSIDAHYELAISADDLCFLGLDADRQPRIGTEVRCLAVVAVTENGHISANLLAPVVINPATGQGLQAIRSDSTYSHQHAVTGEACS
jgi:flagellar assembly factor FliW